MHMPGRMLIADDTPETLRVMHRAVLSAHKSGAPRAPLGLQ
jgi:hypothetical protein